MFYFAIQNRCKITSIFETTFMFSRFFFIFFYENAGTYLSCCLSVLNGS